MAYHHAGWLVLDAPIDFLPRILGRLLFCRASSPPRQIQTSICATSYSMTGPIRHVGCEKVLSASIRERNGQSYGVCVHLRAMKAIDLASPNVPRGTLAFQLAGCVSDATRATGFFGRNL